MFRYTDYLFGNETEAQAFAEAQGWEVRVRCPHSAAWGCSLEAATEWQQRLQNLLLFCGEVTTVMRLNHGWSWGVVAQTKGVPEIALKISQMPKLNDSRPRTVVITQGSQPTVVVENGKVCIQSSGKL